MIGRSGRLRSYFLRVRPCATTSALSSPTAIPRYRGNHSHHHGNHSHHHGNQSSSSSFRPIPVLLAASGSAVLTDRSVRETPVSLTDELATQVTSPAPDTRRIRALLKEGADPNFRLPGGWTLLHHAVAVGNHRVVKELLRFDCDVNGVDEFPYPSTPVHHHAVPGIRYARQLFGGGNFRSDADWRGGTALHYAALNDDEKMVRILLDAGADTTLRTRHGGVTARELAVDKEIISLLEKKEAERRRQRILGLGPFLRERVVGQGRALAAVTAAVQRRNLGWQEEKPLVMLFVGSSGIGKTETAKRLAEYMRQDSGEGGKGGGGTVDFIRVDMSEFQEKHEVAKFIGSPPGYVGHEQGGQLTRSLQAAPESVVLLDEVEKAHPDVLNIMLQLFDEGRITDGKGVTVSCPRAVFVMTTNVGADQIAATAGAEEEVDEDFKKYIMYPLLKRAFRRNEFLGRINEIVYFLPFSTAECEELVRRELERIREYAAKLNMTFSWDGEAVKLLAEALDTNYGARSLKNEVSRRVVDRLADMNLENMIGAGSRVELTVKGGELSFGQC